MDRWRARIESFALHLLRRCGVERRRALDIAIGVGAVLGTRRRRALAAALVAGALVGAILLWRRVRRALPTVIAIGATLALAGWFILGAPRLPSGGSPKNINIPILEGRKVGEIPMPGPFGPQVVENGVAAVVACGKKRGLEGLDAATAYVPEPRTGGWSPNRWGDCTIWYHHPPDAEQRENRHQRAEQRRLAGG
jgi:hypothetical protein